MAKGCILKIQEMRIQSKQPYILLDFAMKCSTIEKKYAVRENMQKIEKTELKQAIKKNYPYMDEKLCEFHAQKIIDETDERLHNNINQWIHGEPLDADMIGDYCIDKILQIRGEQDFLSALEAMNMYLQDHLAGEHMI